MEKGRMSKITTKEMLEELKNRGKSSDEILKFLSTNEECTITSKEDEDQKIERTVTNILREIGVPAHIKGYAYLRSAIIYVSKDSSYLGSITKKLYPNIANEFGTTSSRVERAIRHAIEVAFNRGNIRVWLKYFFSVTEKAPTNSEFIAVIADEINMH